MSRKAYLCWFMSLAVMFVPVLTSDFWGGLVAPCSFVMFEIFLQRGDMILLWLFAFEIAVYLFIFFALAWASFRLSTFFQDRVGRGVVQSVFLFVLFLCSFLRVIQESGGMAEAMQSGTYNFWEACIRFFQTYQRYFH